MCVDNDRRVLRDVTSGLLGATLYQEGTEATEIDILLVVGEAHADLFHESFDSGGHVFLGYTNLVSNFVDDFCLGHFFICLYINNVKI